MDSNTVLILLNVIVSLIHLFDTFIQRIKSSSCWGVNLTMTDNNPINNNNNSLVDINKLMNIINKNDVYKIDISSNKV